MGTIGRIYEKNGQENGGKKVAVLEQRNKFSVGDVVEIMKPDGQNIHAKVLQMTDKDGKPMESCPHPQQKIFVRFDRELCENELVRQKELDQ